MYNLLTTSYLYYIIYIILYKSKILYSIEAVRARGGSLPPGILPFPGGTRKPPGLCPSPRHGGSPGQGRRKARQATGQARPPPDRGLLYPPTSYQVARCVLVASPLPLSPPS